MDCCAFWTTWRNVESEALKVTQSALEFAAYWTAVPRLEPLGDGHIHDTFLLSGVDLSAPIVLQRVNEVVFQDGELVMSQTTRLLDHWHKQDEYAVAQLVPTLSGEAYLQMPGNLWRAWQYLADGRVVDPLRNPAQAFAAGRAFGRFQNCMDELPGPALLETIPGFLLLSHYLLAYDEVADVAPLPERRLIDEQRYLAEQLVARNAHIHGDCKINNLLFDTSADSVLAIIDFDTAMYGHWAWDFGDLMRSVWLSLGGCDVEYYEACLAGFASAQLRVNPHEAQLAPLYVCLMLGIRFLTDHLTGDTYFRVSEPGENLIRAQQQFRLLEDCLAQQALLRERTERVLQKFA